VKKEIRNIPLTQIKWEEGSEELLQSPDMQPYMRLALALAKGEDSKSALDELAKLPLEKRYTWRVVSALKWAFVDLDTGNVAADIKTLSAQDLAKIHELLQLRPAQFNLFMTAVFGKQTTR